VATSCCRVGSGHGTNDEGGEVPIKGGDGVLRFRVVRLKHQREV
jgi:hypothetical protein